MSKAEYKGLTRNAAALADIAESRDERIADLERQLAEAQKALALRDPNFIVTRLEMWAESRLVERNKELQDAENDVQETLRAVNEEIHTVTHGKETCEHAVCGLARRIAAILGEKGA